MSRHFTFLVVLLVASLSLQVGQAQANYSVTSSWPGGLIIDHNCIQLDAVPSEWIDAAQADTRIHYAHTSHGSQITTGMGRIEAANVSYDCAIGGGYLPSEPNALCILDGNPPESYITPELYWQGVSARALTQNTLDDNPTLTISLWSWCTQLNYYDAAGTQEYLDAMTMLEEANPDITFIYMTSNAQAGGSDGYNRWINNQMVRQYCIENDKILFDFADLDCWSGGEHSTYSYFNGEQTFDVPIEHEDFNGNEAGHTTYTSCEQKGRAFWWMMAMLAGWDNPYTASATGSTTSSGTGTTPTNSAMDVNTLVLVGVGIVALASIAAVFVKRR